MDRILALRALERVVERGSFTGAAEDLQVKQSTVSKWMAAWEAELGVALFERTTRRLRVTEAGQRFLAGAREVLAAYDAALAEVQAVSPELMGPLRVSVPVVFGRRHVAPWVAAFVAAHPRIDLELRFDDRYVDLVAEPVDLAIRVGRSVDSSHRAVRLVDGPRRIVASPDFVAAHPVEEPADLGGRIGLIHAGVPRAMWRLERDGEVVTTQVAARLRANHSEVLLDMARAGLGVAMLADWVVREAVDAGELVVLLPGWTLPPAPVRAVFPPSGHVHPRVRAFVAHLREGLATTIGAHRVPGAS